MPIEPLGTIAALASKVSHIPGLAAFSPAAAVPQRAELEGFLTAQRLARKAAVAVGEMVQEGWSERQTAEILDTYLRDQGVKAFFHKSFVWFGERTRFRGVKTYADYLPSGRVALPGEAMILDVAPIVDGFICDIGYSSSLGHNNDMESAKSYLRALRSEILDLVRAGASGANLWESIDKKIVSAGYENIHAQYPFSVLGHRVHHLGKMGGTGERIGMLNFGWQSYWAFLSRGLFGQLLNQNYTGKMQGLWAIEPHIGGPDFGAKFEEILVVEGNDARWIESEML